MYKWLSIGALFSCFLNVLSAADQTVVYTHPGIVINQDGQWVGSDHLLNLTNKIQVVVEILKPADAKIPVSVETLRAQIEAAFIKGGLLPNEVNTDTPGIPFFNLLIVTYPIDKGYAGLIDGRLIESVDPLRVKLEKNTLFQAITWEKKTLVVAPTDEFKETVEKTVADLVKTFIERYEYFEKLKIKLDKKDDVQRLH